MPPETNNSDFAHWSANADSYLYARRHKNRWLQRWCSVCLKSSRATAAAGRDVEHAQSTMTLSSGRVRRRSSCRWRHWWRASKQLTDCIIIIIIIIRSVSGSDSSSNSDPGSQYGDVQYQKLRTIISSVRLYSEYRDTPTPRYAATFIICPIAIAYSMGQIIKSVCVCQCVSLSVCLSVRLRALSRSHFLINFHQKWHRRKNPQNEERVRYWSISHHPFPCFAPQNLHFRPKGPENPCKY